MLELFRMSEKLGKKSYAFVKERLLRENCRNTAWNNMGKWEMKKIQQFENGSGRAKTILELKLVKDVNGNKKPVSST